MVKKMVMEHTLSLLGLSMLENTKMGIQMDTQHTLGLMGVSMLENTKMGKEMV